ncbi:ATP-binding protein [Streptomyces sp. NRRL S-646]|uniref:HD domain-containing protein n=1 Tax=Streptomyces sp. NRRL S-646 TaxID=1463917 RepID=UPI001331600F|nr:ATP-binding protein [Streptomyces sp. NRRL S-646]
MAQQAGSLEAFGGISVVQTRREVEELLSHIGKDGLFDQYTKHDISHIVAMLGKLDWLITEETKEAMSGADWLLIVLATYFHDLGMLVTKDEFERRGQSSFADFCEENLMTDDNDGRDYKTRIAELSEEEREKFLYQEFVRYHHATRVANWIEGKQTNEIGVATTLLEEVKRILAPLDDVFREDLAKVCESHHLEDLDNAKKYPVRRYYGATEQEKANVQFAAILLRTVDLLHITRDRTPSIAFRVLKPSDPVSQAEWAKQSAVRAVTPKPGYDGEGNVSETAARDTIEVHARFTDGDGFFGLTSYLNFASAELRASHEWAEKSTQNLGVNHVFPWKEIDTTKVEAKGFLTEPFQFSLDQEKVLDLLTGHTLYNDSNVVLRELIQNSIDAVRLEHGELSVSMGEVRVKWDSAERTLEVWDNGTGMTQRIIENNLLRAGSSRYQDPEFKKQNPDFSPISRFGIGVLSTFMIADQVEVLTCHPNEEKARQLSLRSVHGKYLVRTLDKECVPSFIRPHGTVVKLSLRPSAKPGDFLSVAKNWVVLPDCQVSVQINNEEPVSIGFASMADALESFIRDSAEGNAIELDKQKIRVIQRDGDGFSIAYAVRWNEYFREWTFLDIQNQDDEDEESDPMVGVCVGGIRVEGNTPGYREPTFWAIANSFGPNAPRTNVARSAVDATPEYKRFINNSYEAFCAHVEEEVSLLQSKRGYSLTWATAEANVISADLTSGRPVSQSQLREVVSSLPLFVVEQGEERKSISAKELNDYDAVHVIHSSATDHMEHLLREIPGASRAVLGKMLNRDTVNDISASDLVICSHLGRYDFADSLLLSAWEVSGMVLDNAIRSCKFTLGRIREASRWSRTTLRGTFLEKLQEDRDHYTGRPFQLVRLPLQGVVAAGFDEGETLEYGAVLGDMKYLRPGHPWQSMVDDVLASPLAPHDKELRVTLLAWLISLSFRNRGLAQARPSALLGSLDEIKVRLERLRVTAWIDFEKFAEVTQDVDRLEIFDTRRWSRGYLGF